MKRKTFLKTSAILATGSLISPLISCKEQPKPQQQAAKTARKNWAGNYQYKAENLHQPNTVEEVQALVKKLGKQILFLHLKDLQPGTPLDYTVFEVKPEVFLEIGSGSIDFKSIFTVAKEAGIPYALLDQDHTAMDKIESVKKSYTYLKELGM